MAGNVSQLGNIFGDVAIKAACRLASSAGNITLNGLQSIDGLALADGDRVLVTAQSDVTLNGIWRASTGPWTRTADAAKNTDFIDGTLVPVARGLQNAGQMFQLQCADSPVILGSSLLAFTAQSAVATAQQSASSTTSLAVGTGSKTFAIAAGKAFSASQYVVAFETSAPGNAMVGQITSYAGTSLVVNMLAAGGAGTHADWTIALVNSPASAGRVPPLGTGNVTGPGSAVAGNLASFTDTTGKLISDSGLAPGTLAGRNALLFGDAGTASIGEAALVSGAGARPFVAAQPNDNLHLVNDVTNPTRDINVTPGRCPDDADTIYLQLAGTMVKRLDTAWAAGGAAGAPVGGCDTGSKGASQTWHIFAIAKRNLAITQVSRTGNVATVTSTAHGLGAGGSVRHYGIGLGFDGLAVITAVTANSYSYNNTGANVGATVVAALADGFDILASQTYGGPTMPAGWTVKQCLGSFLTDGAGNIRAMTQIGDSFVLAADANDGATLGTSRSNLTLTVPTGVAVAARFRGSSGAGGTIAIVFTSLLENDVAPVNGVNADLTYTSTSVGAAGSFERITDTSARIAGRANLAAVGVGIATYGWRDPRRRLF